MRHALLGPVIAGALALGGATQAQLAPGPAVAAAMAAARSGDWSAARDAVAPLGDPAADTLILWRALLAGSGDWPAYRDFIAAHPDWPRMAALRQRAELTIPPRADPATVLAFFAEAPPQTGAGALRLAEALAADGRPGEAAEIVVAAWREMPLNAEDEAAFLAAWGGPLRPHHTARLDRLLWQGRGDAARRMLPRVPEDWRALAEARLALRALAPGVDARIEAVPRSLQDDPGLAFERFLWRVRKGREADALILIEAASAPPAALGDPAAWAPQRRRLARLALQDGDAVRAYDLAARHGLSAGADFAALEWLAGYAALRGLDDPGRAAAHFSRLQDGVDSPISLGRAGYWLGRALEAAGDAAGAAAAFAQAAQHQTSFYGQLAAERAGIAPDPDLTGAALAPAADRARIAAHPVVRAAALLLAAGERGTAERFLVHLAGVLPAADLPALGDAILDLGAPHIALMAAKRAATRGIVLPRPYYPLTAMARYSYPVETALVLAIARRESEFAIDVVSPAGALGLMQLMPATAEAVAGAAGLPWENGRLTRDWQYNAALGSLYLAELMAIYDGALPLVAAAYNAGPNRVDAWLEEIGDPRTGRIDPVDWVEAIPFAETRNYVMRVMESLHVYRARLTGQVPAWQLAAELGGAPAGR
jgi:soluble lytic murein transglycosylase